MVPCGSPPHIVNLESWPVGCDGLGVDSYPSFAPRSQYLVSIGFEGPSNCLVCTLLVHPHVTLYHVASNIHKGTHSDGEHAVLNGVSDYCVLYASDWNVDDNPLVGLICERSHFESLNHKH